MHILTVSWEYPPLVYGGLGRHVHGLATALVAAGHDVTVLTQGHPGAAPEAHVEGVRVRRLPPAARDIRDGPADGFPGRIARLADGLRALGADVPDDVDVIHAHDWMAADAAISLADSRRVPLVATVHATEAGLWDGWITSAVSVARHDAERWLVRAADRRIVCSSAMVAEVSTALGIAPRALDLVPNGVDPVAWATTSQRRDAMRDLVSPGTTEGRLLVLAGRIEWEKGGDDAIDALARLTRAGRDVRLAFAGTGRHDPRLRAQAGRLGVTERVAFLGHLDGADIAALLAAADVVLVPSSYEPFGMVALEAGAAGTPVVAAAVGGLRDVVDDGITGLLVPPRDPAALAGGIARLLDDDGLGDRLVAAARDRIDREFTWSRVAKATTEIMTEAVAGYRPPAASGVGRMGRSEATVPGNVIDRLPVAARATWRRARGDEPETPTQV